jgi:hypothetical protein
MQESNEFYWRAFCIGAHMCNSIIRSITNLRNMDDDVNVGLDYALRFNMSIYQEIFNGHSLEIYISQQEYIDSGLCAGIYSIESIYNKEDRKLSNFYYGLKIGIISNLHKYYYMNCGNRSVMCKPTIMLPYPYHI